VWGVKRSNHPPLPIPSITSPLLPHPPFLPAPPPQHFSRQYKDVLDVDIPSMTYAPMAWLNDFWLLREGLVPLNASTGAVTLRLSLYAQKSWQHMMLAQLQESFKLQQSWGAMNEGEPDDLKRILTEGNPYFLALTMAVSLAHSLLDVLAFKADVGFWKGKQDVKGLSVRTIAFNAGCQAVILLYLFDNDTSMVVLGSAVMGLGVECWKLTQAMDVSIERGGGAPAAAGAPLATRLAAGVAALLPVRLVLKDKASYSESDTDRFDKEATKYMGIALVPCVLGYSLYSLKTQTHRSFYSWAVASLVGAVYAFGFVLMCPQLWINYRLKVRGAWGGGGGMGREGKRRRLMAHCLRSHPRLPWERGLCGLWRAGVERERREKTDVRPAEGGVSSTPIQKKTLSHLPSPPPISKVCRPPPLAPAGVQVSGHYRGRPVCVCDQDADAAQAGEKGRHKKGEEAHAPGDTMPAPLFPHSRTRTLSLSRISHRLLLCPPTSRPFHAGRLPRRHCLLRLPLPALGLQGRPVPGERVRLCRGARAWRGGRGRSSCAGGGDNRCGEWGGDGRGHPAAGWWWW